MIIHNLKSIKRLHKKNDPSILSKAPQKIQQKHINKQTQQNFVDKKIFIRFRLCDRVEFYSGYFSKYSIANMKTTQ